MTAAPRGPWEGRPLEEKIAELKAALREARKFIELAAPPLCGFEQADAMLARIDKALED